MSKRITPFVCSALLVLGLGVGTSAVAQTYPSKPVKILVPYPPGGPYDGFARGLADGLTKKWGQQVIVDNKPGAAEIVASQALTTSPGDGYTLLLGSDAPFSHNQFLFSKLPYDPKDIIPITQVVNVNMVLIVKGDLPVKDLKEFVALMKKEGEKHNYGSAGIGNATHLAFEAFKDTAGFKMTHVAYKGIAPAMTDMLNGAIDAMMAGSSVAIPHLKTGKVKVLAISGPKRAPALPDVPTYAEAGYKEYESRFFMGLGAAKGTPRPVVQKIAQDVHSVVQDKGFIAKYVDIYGFESVGSSPEDFETFLKRDREISAKRIRAANVKLD